jgi:phosphoglycolate phosphatase-like HAD superfamily hydrolase
MEKPIIAVSLAGLFVKSEPWDKAHILWFNEAAEKLKDSSIKGWIDKPNYFKGVDEVMKRLYPKLTDEKRTEKARELFFESVCKYIGQNPKLKNKDIIDYFSALKKEFKIALITTNTDKATKKILKILELSNFFDIIETSKLGEKDDKRAVFDRFIQKHGKPLVYIGGGRKDSYDYCKEKNISRIFANLEAGPEIAGVESVNTFHALEKAMKKYI